MFHKIYSCTNYNIKWMYRLWTTYNQDCIGELHRMNYRCIVIRIQIIFFLGGTEILFQWINNIVIMSLTNTYKVQIGIELSFDFNFSNVSYCHYVHHQWILIPRTSLNSTTLFLWHYPSTSHIPSFCYTSTTNWHHGITHSTLSPYCFFVVGKALSKKICDRIFRYRRNLHICCQICSLFYWLNPLYGQIQLS